MGRLLLIFFSFKVGRLLAREGGNCEEVVSSPEKIILHLVHVLIFWIGNKVRSNSTFACILQCTCMTYMYIVHTFYVYVWRKFKKIQVYLTCGKAMWSTVVEKSENLWKMNLVRAGKRPTTQLWWFSPFLSVCCFTSPRIQHRSSHLLDLWGDK